MKVKIYGWKRRKLNQEAFSKRICTTISSTGDAIYSSGSTHLNENKEIVVGFKSTDLVLSSQSEYLFQISLSSEDLATLSARQQGLEIQLPNDT